MNNDSARDKAMDKLVEAKLRSGLAPRSASCLDPGVMAAYVDRALTPRERADCEAHLSSCANCQEQVAVLVRLSEADEPVIIQTNAAPARTAAINWFRWAWAGPALAALLVIGVYVSGPFRHDIQQVQGPESGIQQPVGTQPAAAPPAAKGAEDEITTAPASGAVNAQKQPVAEKKSLDLKSRADNTAGRPEGRQNEQPQAGVLGGITRRGEPPAKTQNDGSAQPAAASPFPSPPAPASNNVAPAASGAIATPSERAALAKDDRGQAAGVGGGSTKGGAGSEISEEHKDNPPANQPMGNFSTQRRAAQTAGPQTVPPPTSDKTASRKSTLPDEAKAKEEAQATDMERDKLTDNFHAKQQTGGRASISASPQGLMAKPVAAAPSWRVGQHGLIEKMNEEGKWKKQKSGVKSGLNAIASSNPDVAWAVGQAGTVLRTIDGGATWRQVAKPTTEDLVHVTATSDQAASVVTSGGQTFNTADGGTSWSVAAN